MKRLICATVAGVLLACAVVVGNGVGVAHADTPCLDTIQSFPTGVVEGASLSFAGAPLLGPAATPTLGSAPVLTAGSAAAGGSVIGATGLMLAAAGVGVGLGCVFVDVLNAGNLALEAWCGSVGWWCGEPAPTGSFVGHEGVTYGPRYSTPPYQYRLITVEGLTSFGAGWYWQWVGPENIITPPGLVLGQFERLPQYELPESDGPFDPGHYYSSSTACSLMNFSSTSQCRVKEAGLIGSDRLRYNCSTTVDLDGPGGSATTAEVTNAGNRCTQLPGAMLVVEPNGALPLGLLTPFFPEVNESGWLRRYVADAYCWNPDSGTSTWRRFEGESFYDKPNDLVPTVSRPSVGRCLTGEVAAETLITLVPTNVNCTLGAVCWPNSEVVRLELPTEWVTTGTAPDWIECLAVNNSCGSGPVLDVGDVNDPEDDSCGWGSAVVDLTWCDPEHQVQTEVGPDVGVTTVEILLPDTPEGEAVSTGTPVSVLEATSAGDGPPSGPDTVVGIDTGDNAEVCKGSLAESAATLLDFGWSVPDIVGKLGCRPLLEGGECWPDGWGFFNPAEWVFKPIKCALVWAFVPSDQALEDFLDQTRTTVAGTFPLSWWAGAMQSAEAFADSAADTSNACLDLDAEVGGVEVECIAIPGGLLTVDQRAIVVNVLIAAVAASVVWHAIREVSSS